MDHSDDAALDASYEAMIAKLDLSNDAALDAAFDAMVAKLQFKSHGYERARFRLVFGRPC